MMEGDFPGGPVPKTSCSNAGGPGSIPSQANRSHKQQLRVCMLKLEILSAATKTWCSLTNKY